MKIFYLLLFIVGFGLILLGGKLVYDGKGEIKGASNRAEMMVSLEESLHAMRSLGRRPVNENIAERQRREFREGSNRMDRVSDRRSMLESRGRKQLIYGIASSVIGLLFAVFGIAQFRLLSRTTKQ